MYCPNCPAGPFTSERDLARHLCEECPEKTRYTMDNAMVTAGCCRQVEERIPHETNSPSENERGWF